MDVTTNPEQLGGNEMSVEAEASGIWLFTAMALGALSAILLALSSIM